MRPSELRELLLQQHQGLRDLLAAAQAPAGRDLERLLAELREALSVHNMNEEALLDAMLRQADAWGDLRAARMREEHLAEHAIFRDALQGTPAEVAQRMSELAEDLLAHMEAEERTFLSAGVLRDDIISLGPSG